MNILQPGETLLPDSVASDRGRAFEQLYERQLKIDLDILNVYDIDNVPESTLFDLADQFNVLGFRGWVLASTTEQRRQLVKNSIELHRVAGTPFAVKRALESVGYPNATIEENPGLRYDGSVQYDGTQRYLGGQLGQFIVTLDSIRGEVSTEKVALIIALINEWKNARSHLGDLRIGDISLFGNLLIYDGRIRYDGANGQTYNAELAT